MQRSIPSIALITPTIPRSNLSIINTIIARHADPLPALRTHWLGLHLLGFGQGDECSIPDSTFTDDSSSHVSNSMQLIGSRETVLVEITHSQARAARPPENASSAVIVAHNVIS